MRSEMGLIRSATLGRFRAGSRRMQGSCHPGCVNIRLLLCVAWLVSPALSGSAESPSASPSPSPARLASFKERLAAAQSARVRTDLLGIEIGSELEAARRQLEKSTNQDRLSKEAGEDEGAEQRVLWELKDTEFASILVKADQQDRIIYMTGVLRAGKEIPFATIGEVEKAPVRTDHEIAWDVVRPNHPLVRVVASGSNSKAFSITIFS